MANRKKKNRFQFLTKKFPVRMQKKLVMLFIAIILAFVVLIGRITFINASKGSRYTKIVLDQQEYDSRVIPFKRGDIVDRNGTKMALSERVYNVILDVHVLASDEKYLEPTVKVLKDCFGIDEDTVRKLAEDSSDSRYEVLAKDVTYDKAQAYKEIEKNTKKYPNVKGIWLEDDYLRSYPYGTLASDVIGFSGSGNSGALGIESAYNSVLNGTDGREYGYFDSISSTERTVKAAKNGNTIVSTIDVTLQSIVEQCIKEFNDAHAGEARTGEPGSKNTAVMIMNPNTGEILAEASYPNFDLNNPDDLTGIYSAEKLSAMSDEDKQNTLNDLWRNFCVSDAFEPGSTAKPFTVAAGLESGTLKGDETYTCGGSLQVADTSIRCHSESGHGTQSIEQAIANSCNVALMQMGEQIGVENFTRYQHIFGFGEYTGIDLPGEASTASLIHTADDMGIVDLATNAFGQNFNVTMTQMTAAFSSLINGGDYYEPHVVKQIQDEDGKVVETRDPVLLRKTISTDTSNMLKPYLRSVLTYGTGTGAAVEGYDIGGKTGTAEKYPRDNGNYILSFIGCAPVDNPEVVVYVVIDEPNVSNQSASSYVLELSQKIMAQAFPYLDITTVEGYTATTNGAIPTDQLNAAADTEQYTDYDSDYVDDSGDEAGDYSDESYSPDLDDWAAAQPAE